VTERSVEAAEAFHRFLTLYRYLRAYSRDINAQGIRGRELSTLRYLLEAGPVTIGQVCDYLFISVSATSEQLSRMEEAGYVARTRSKQDSRVVYVELTPEGRRIAEETPLGGIPLLRERIKMLSPERLAQAGDVFGEILEVMEIPQES